MLIATMPELGEHRSACATSGFLASRARALLSMQFQAFVVATTAAVVQDTARPKLPGYSPVGKSGRSRQPTYVIAPYPPSKSEQSTLSRLNSRPSRYVVQNLKKKNSGHRKQQNRGQKSSKFGVQFWKLFSGMRGKALPVSICSESTMLR